jgi:hypothetical protein
MKAIFYFLFVFTLFSCTTKESVPPIKGTINIDVKNNDLVFSIERVHFLTDSVYLHFATVDLYDCDKYRINMASTNTDEDVSIILGNVYRDGGFCVFGQFPATNNFKSKALPLGKYKLSVKRNNDFYDGELNVTNSAYSITWNYDSNCMKIEPKTFLK